MKSIRIGTRGSALALWQANHVASKLREAAPDLETEVVTVRTKGDKIQNVPLSQVRGQGFFVKEIETALLRREVDVAVHSCKDMPTALAEGLELGAILSRANAQDCLVSRGGLTLAELPDGASVATSSLRRQAQLARVRPDIQRKELRGNITTRLGKLDDGLFDAMIVARAALDRLELGSRVAETLPMSTFLPAVAQGALSVEIRSGEPELRSLAAALDDATTRAQVLAERALLSELRGGCQLPLGAHATCPSSEVLDLTGQVLSPSGDRSIVVSRKGPIQSPEALGVEVAALLVSRGAQSILSELQR